MAPSDHSDDERHDDLDEDGHAILARRRALIRRSLGALGAAVLGGLAIDCGAPPQPCLTAIPDDAMVDSATDATPEDAVDAADAMPQPCLAPIPDGGEEP
jgi:hypothetical protein